MPGIARVGDIGVGTCPCHFPAPISYITTFATGASTVNTNGSITTIISTIGISTCGHPTVALTGSPNVNAESQPVHRLGDIGSNCGPYITVTASTDTIAN